MNKKQLAYGAGLVAGVVLLAIARNKMQVSIPNGAKAVEPFDISKYLGRWYEIARMDFKYEKGLEQVTAIYTINIDNTVKVDNTGYDPAEKRWKRSIGKAKFAGDSTCGRLKVSFFGPFYAGYNVIGLDNSYQHALVAGNNLNYLWILSRNKTIPQHTKDEFLHLAEKLGYNIKNLIWTKQV